MPVDRFRFVSPGVFINEIDQSQIPSVGRRGAGPVVFGVARKGPALVPITVSSFSQFVQLFGEPEPGSDANGDPWREGNRSNPTYGAYAAQAYLANGAPLTFVRLVGDQDPAATAAGAAGWNFPTLSSTSEGGPYGLFIMGSGSAEHAEGMLAAVFYLTGSGSRIELSGNLANTTTSTAAAGALVEPVTVGSNSEFKVRITGPNEGTVETSFNFDPKSARYIRKVFNTNPQFLNTNITKESNRKDHFLGPSYERSVLDFVQQLDGGDITRTNFTDTYGVILGLVSGSANGSDFRFGYKTPGTPWIVGQDLGDNSGSFDINSTVPRLFRVHSRNGVEYAQSNYKISFSDIKPSPNPQFEPYGTFTLLVRDMKDTDENPVIYEQFNNLSLNPASNNFIAKRIGDRSFQYDSTNKKWRETGQYDLQSYYIRVEMDENVDRGDQEASLLPFGFRGVPVFRGFNAKSGSATLHDYSLTTAGTADVYSIFADGGSGSLPTDSLPLPGAAVATGSLTFTGVPYSPTAGPGEGFGLALTNSAGAIELFVPSTSSLRGAQYYEPMGLEQSGTIVYWNATGSYATAATTATNLAAALNDAAVSSLGFTVTNPTAAQVDLTQSSPGVYNHLLVVSTSVGHAAPLSASLAGLLGGAGAAGVASALYFGAAIVATASFVSPTLPLRAKSGDGLLARPTNAFFGLTTNQSAGTLIFDGSNRDLVRVMPQGLDADSNILGPGFSLDDLVVSAGAAAHSGSELGSYFNNIVGNSGVISAASPYRGTPQGGRRAGTSATAVSSSYKQILDDGYDRFTVPLYGGFNGFDILERNPFNNKRALAGTTKTTAAAPMYYTLKKSIDSVSDVDQVNINMAAMPGVTDQQTTNYLLAMAEDRKDTLAIIDLEGGFIPSTENTDSFAERKGTSAATVAAVEDRNFNSSYGCAYYPWVQINDTGAGRRVWVPPSTIAMGVLAASAARTELWFAPAGFNRGGLNNGNAGLNVVNVVEKLTSNQRDNLYEVNVNPIASFPAEGIVVFGQKTLQATPSALDRINVRRLMIYLKKQVTIIANGILFDPNIQITWNRFLNRVEPFLGSVKNRFGLSDFRVILDSSTTTPDMVDRNILYAKILLKPTRAIEFIALDFVITRSGVEF